MRLKRRMVKQSDVEETSQSDKADKMDKSKNTCDKMKLIKENLHLLSEIEKLKNKNNSLSQRLYYLESLHKP